MSMTIDKAKRWIVDESGQVSDHLTRYFERHDDIRADTKLGFTGRLFERHRQETDSFTESDMLAVAALGVQVRPHIAEHLIEDVGQRWSSQIKAARAAIKPYRSLANLPVELVQSGPLCDLYEDLKLFRKLGFGKVTKSKLLATKFPAHVPIRDSRVEGLLGLKKSNDWWMSMRELLGAPGVRETLAAVHLEGDGAKATPLRRLDVVLWMEHLAQERRRRRTAGR
jgi:hypothetical protein